MEDELDEGADEDGVDEVVAEVLEVVGKVEEEVGVKEGEVDTTEELRGTVSGRRATPHND